MVRNLTKAAPPLKGTLLQACPGAPFAHAARAHSAARRGQRLPFCSSPWSRGNHSAAGSLNFLFGCSPFSSVLPDAGRFLPRPSCCSGRNTQKNRRVSCHCSPMIPPFPGGTFRTLPKRPQPSIHIIPEPNRDFYSPFRPSEWVRPAGSPAGLTPIAAYSVSGLFGSPRSAFSSPQRYVFSPY